jgi:hypothetical protein
MDTIDKTKKLTDAYYQLKRMSTCITITIWKHSQTSHEFNIEYDLSTVSNMHECRQKYFKTLEDLEEFIKDEINYRKENEILYRRFK